MIQIDIYCLYVEIGMVLFFGCNSMFTCSTFLKNFWNINYPIIIYISWKFLKYDLLLPTWRLPSEYRTPMTGNRELYMFLKNFWSMDRCYLPDDCHPNTTLRRLVFEYRILIVTIWTPLSEDCNPMIIYVPCLLKFLKYGLLSSIW